MENLIRILVLGEGTEKFKMVTTAYIVFMCSLITNFILNQWNFYFINHEIKLNDILSFIISPSALIVAGVFTAVYAFATYYLKFLFSILSYVCKYVLWVIANTFSILILILVFSVGLLTLRIKFLMKFWKTFNFTTLKELNINEIVKSKPLQIFTEENGRKIQGKHFGYYKEFAQILQDKKISEQPFRLATIFVLTFLNYRIYGIGNLIPYSSTIFIILKTLAIFYSINLMSLLAISRHREDLMSLLLEIKMK